MRPTEMTAKHVIERYVQPARRRGDGTVSVRVGDVVKELGWTNRTPSVYSTLSSEQFLQKAGIKLIEKRGGPVSGGPSTTVQFVYRLGEGAGAAAVTKASDALLVLEGIGTQVYRKLGGGEAYLRNERNALQFSAEPHAGKSVRG